LIDARDAILSADDLANGGTNRRKIWEAFARHGFGHSARALGKLAGADPLVFDAAWDLPPDYVTTNRGPKVISQPPEYAMYGEKLTYSIKASDPEGDKLTYELVDGPSGMTVDANTGLLQWMPTFTARRAVIRITDGKDGKVTHGILVPVFTPLEANRPIGIEGPRNSLGVAVMNVPAKTTILQFTLRGGNGDPDMTVVDPLFDIYGISFESGTTETISVAAPEAGFWGVIVEASGAYQNVTLKGALLGAEVLTPGIPKPGLSGDRTSETFYKVVVPEGASRLRVTTSGGTGDLDLMARFGKAPVCSGILAPCDFDEASWENGNQESVDIADVLPGEWFINLSGYEAYQDATLLVTLIGPDFSAEGVTNGASFLPPVSPGGIFTVFGKKLAREEAKAGSVPLPTTLGDTSVTVNGTPAPLFYVSPVQINAQIPFETKPGEASVVVKSGDMLSDAVKISVLASAPGIFLYGGDKPVVVNHEDGSLNDAAHPVKAGKYIIAYLTGVSPLDNPLQTGAAVPYPPLFQCTAPFSATLGGKPVEVGFLGLTPNYVGLGQANIKTPADLAPGNHALRITIGGVESNGPIVAVAAP
jgi:uncharacterized protein (TIGR03437 family)